MTVKDFFENFEDNDKSGGVIHIVADNNNGHSYVTISYNHVDKKDSMWSGFIAMYGDYIITKWHVDEKDIFYKTITLYVKENNGEGKFDYNISYNVKEWYDERRASRRVHKSELADALEDIFKWGGYDVKISCVERKNNDNT